MTWIFNNLQTMKQFAHYLSNELKSIGELHWADEVNSFSYNSFPSSSEYLGELRIVLKQMMNEIQNLPDHLKQEIRTAIESINKAFGN
jgi:hypothetical protein